MRYVIDIEANDNLTLVGLSDGALEITLRGASFDFDWTTFTLNESQLEELLKAIALVKSDGKKPNPNTPVYPPGVRGGSFTTKDQEQYTINEDYNVLSHADNPNG